MVEDTETRTKGSRKGKNTQVRVDNNATSENEPEAINDEADGDTDSDSNFDDGDKRYNFRTLAKLLEPVPKLTSRNYHSWSAHVKSFLRSVPHAMKHLEGTYDKKHPKWSRSLDDALINALRGTINTTGEHNVNYLVLDVIKEYLTFNQVWRKIENGLTNEATKTSHRLALISQLNDAKMFHSDARKLIQEIRSIQTESSLLGKPFADDTLFSALQKCVRGLAPETQLGTININVMMTPRSGVSVDDDEVDGVGDEIGDVDDNEVDGVGDKVGGVDDNEVDGVGDKVGGVNTSVQCVDLMLEVIPGPQWTTAFGSIYIRTANLLWAPSDVR
ncbi:hypothetical protein NDA10_007986 [Ustilago hordei]|nr:hypothetical protein NDA10_007986 [Ustilago hordei]